MPSDLGENQADKPGFRLSKEKLEAEERGQRLRQALRDAGGNKVVSERSGVPTSTISAYIAGQDWKLSTTLALAAACGVSSDWLIRGEASDDRPAGRLVSIDPQNPAVPSNYVLIPRYEVRAAAGSGTMVEDENVVGLMALDEMFLRRSLGIRRDALTTIEAAGDSMHPTIRDGDLLVVDTDNNEIQDGRIYVLNIDGLLAVKRLQILVGGKVVLISDNERYQPQIITPSERDPLRIVGRVVYQAGPVRS